ncbi:MAG: hypothetical protein U5R48_14820 [Gammaproteobacteria bacterium]|nr:hypothetical protein [Gammaproteobacteria bacterium]
MDAVGGNTLNLLVNSGGDVAVDAALSLEGDVDLVAGADGATLSLNAAVSGDELTFEADDMDLAAVAGATAVNLDSFTASNAIDLGNAADDSADVLELSSAELDQISAPLLRSAQQIGTIAVAAAITPAGITDLAPLHRRGIDDDTAAGSVATTGLALGAARSVLVGLTGVDTLAAASNADTDISFVDGDDLAVGRSTESPASLPGPAASR